MELDPVTKYEVVREALIDEIGEQNLLANRCGRDTPQGKAHLKALEKLVELRQILRCSNHRQVDAVDLALQAMFACRSRSLRARDGDGVSGG